MNIEKSNQLLSLLSNLAVLIGIIFLIVEINQNTRAIDNEAAWARTAVTVELNSLIINTPERAQRLDEQSSWSREEWQQQNISDTAKLIEDITYYATRRTVWQARYLTQTDQELRNSLKNLIKRQMLNNNSMRFHMEQNLGDLHPDFHLFLQSILDEVESEKPI